MNHLKDLQEVYESLIDEESRRTFYGYWLGRISNQIGEIVYSKNAHYLIPGFIPENGAIVIDGGVYDGGTGIFFTDMGYKVYGFEMDKKNFEIAKKVADEKGFTVENMGLSDCKKELLYISSSTGSRFDDFGTEKAFVIDLDAYVREKKLPRVDFIKLDVEGSEFDVINGAADTISRWKPILAISAYHKLDDFWTLMNLVKSIRPDYEFAMRQYGTSQRTEWSSFGKDLLNLFIKFGLKPERRNFGECVLFAR